MLKSAHKEEIIKFAAGIPGYYELDELEGLYSLVQGLPTSSIIVEIGVQYGRTASLYLNENRHQVYLIDCWVENEGDSVPYFQKMVRDNHWEDRFTPLWVRSDEATDLSPSNIDLLHIDGGHTPEIIWGDCELYLPKLKLGGVVVFHDYQRKGADPTTGSVFPGVDKAVDHWTQGWEILWTVNTQAARRKIA